MHPGPGLYPAPVAFRRFGDLRLVEQLASMGFAPEDDPDTRLRKGTLTLTAASIGVLAFAWTLTYGALERPLAAAIPLTYQVAAFASLLLLARTKRYDVFRVLQILLMLILPVVLQWSLGGFVGGSAVLVWSFVAPLGALVFAGIRPALLTFAAFVGLVILSGQLDPWLAGRAEPLPVPVIRAFFVLNVLGVAAVTFLVLVYFVRERQRALDELDVAHRALQAEQRNLETEQERSEALLRNVLPDAVARRLKDGQEVIADRYAAVTVLFVDVVGFTPFAARLAPEALVRQLDRVFSELDALTERHGLEKIKTVGDAYIAVAGLPDPMEAEAGARAAAEMALEVFPAVARAMDGVGGLRVRVGMHTGPVVAGVIGRRKFAYDLWGDAVNVASRMESQGLPDRIQVSLDTWQLLQRHYRFRYRGTLEVRGRGEMAAYLLLGPRGDRAPSPPHA
jgi:adenylate cyclase